MAYFYFPCSKIKGYSTSGGCKPCGGTDVAPTCENEVVICLKDGAKLSPAILESGTTKFLYSLGGTIENDSDTPSGQCRVVFDEAVLAQPGLGLSDCDVQNMCMKGCEFKFLEELLCQSAGGGVVSTATITSADTGNLAVTGSDGGTLIGCSQLAQALSVRTSATNSCIQEIVVCENTPEELVAGTINLSAFVTGAEVDAGNPNQINLLGCNGLSVFSFIQSAGGTPFQCSDLVGNIAVRDNVDNACIKEIVLCPGSPDESIAGTIDTSLLFNGVETEISCGGNVGEGTLKTIITRCDGSEAFRVTEPGCYYKNQSTAALGAVGDFVAVKPSTVTPGEYQLALGDDAANEASDLAIIVSATQLKLACGEVEFSTPHGLTVGSSYILSGDTPGGFVDPSTIVDPALAPAHIQELFMVRDTNCLKVSCSPQGFKVGDDTECENMKLAAGAVLPVDMVGTVDITILSDPAEFSSVITQTLNPGDAIPANYCHCILLDTCSRQAIAIENKEIFVGDVAATQPPMDKHCVAYDTATGEFFLSVPGDGWISNVNERKATVTEGDDNNGTPVDPADPSTWPAPPGDCWNLVKDAEGNLVGISTAVGNCPIGGGGSAEIDIASATVQRSELPAIGAPTGTFDAIKDEDGFFRGLILPDGTNCDIRDCCGIGVVEDELVGSSLAVCVPLQATAGDFVMVNGQTDINGNTLGFQQVQLANNSSKPMKFSVYGRVGINLRFDPSQAQRIDHLGNQVTLDNNRIGIPVLFEARLGENDVDLDEPTNQWGVGLDFDPGVNNSNEWLRREYDVKQQYMHNFGMEGAFQDNTAPFLISQNINICPEVCIRIAPGDPARTIKLKVHMRWEDSHRDQDIASEGQRLHMATQLYVEFRYDQ